MWQDAFFGTTYLEIYEIIKFVNKDLTKGWVRTNDYNSDIILSILIYKSSILSYYFTLQSISNTNLLD